jgi:hypothetical protein
VLTSGASAAEVAALELEAVRERFRDAISAAARAW